ncbi:MAG: antibiotic biosynthesis monooxygenase [Alphaproteobacteria bacterium]|nr:antibiotic biosynthesis monooxygenase [Alphaproteobacteria bacterium]
MTAPSGGAAPGPIAILIEFRARPERASELVERLRADATETLRDDGCLRMEVLLDRAPDGCVWLSELWRDRAAIDAHRTKPGHSHAWQEPLIEGKRVVVCDLR